MKPYKNRNSKDSNILVDISNLTLLERWQRIIELKQTLQKTEARLLQKQQKPRRTPKEERAIIAAEDGLLELRYRFNLEQAEYLNQKSISPDFEEPRQ